jgi:hypothetical protein
VSLNQDLVQEHFIIFIEPEATKAHQEYRILFRLQKDHFLQVQQATNSYAEKTALSS